MTQPPNQASNDLPSVVIVIPIYKDRFDAGEQFLVDRIFSVFSEREIVFFAPESNEKDYYSIRYPSAKLITFNDRYFESVQGYSRLLLSKEFYQRFASTEFLLVAQPDVYAFRDELNIWLRKPYDYIGAPWPKGFSVRLNMGRFKQGADGSVLTAFVGNGGFSLRRTQKAILLLEEESTIADWFRETGSNEDLFFSLLGAMTPDFVLPNLIEASLFAMESSPELLYEMNCRKLPMAAHAFTKYSRSFWADHMPSQVLKIFDVSR